MARNAPKRLTTADLLWLTDQDLHLFNEGTNDRAYHRLGAHFRTVAGRPGIQFSVWAPNAEAVSIIGDFNDWDRNATPMRSRGDSGIWESFIPGLEKGACYKYNVSSKFDGYRVDKCDPFGFFHEVPPKTASVVWDLEYTWSDETWMSQRKRNNALDAPMSIYELHLGSWMRVAKEGYRSLSYREITPLLVEHVKRLGFTHVEFMPVMEHPFFGSWGYQVTGYFAPSSRYGTPQDLMYLIDVLHQNDIGVILDWVPAHFPTDEHGLNYFDGTHLFEHSDRRQGFHPDWNSSIFNYGRNEVRSFLLSSALFWLDKYHVDGLRVDGVASMLYLDYSRKDGEWIPNSYGGRENLDALTFLRRFNEVVYKEFPDTVTIAEESTAWPMVSRPTYLGGLGFGMKWDMGWMHDTLGYMSLDPVYRRFHQDELTFRFMYQFNENFVMPLSHDEVVHGKGSLLGKMPGDAWQKLAHLRLLYAFMYACPGKKLLFMGAELGQGHEWKHDESLPWHLLEEAPHRGIADTLRDLNAMYRSQSALHDLDHSPEGFDWIVSDQECSIVVFARRDRSGRSVLAAFNFTPIPRENYRVGVEQPGYWREIMNTDAEIYGGSGVGNLGGLEALGEPWHGRPLSVCMTLPPLGAVFFESPSQRPDLVQVDEVELRSNPRRPLR